MAKLLCAVATAVMFVTGTRTVDNHPHHHHHHHHKNSKIHVQAVPPTPEEQSLFDAKNAREAAVSAKAAANVASKVAAHSINISSKAKEALGNARDALHLARVDAKDLTKEQEEALHKAEARLSNVKTDDAVVARDQLKVKLESKLAKSSADSKAELATMRSVLRELREELARKRASGTADESDAAVDQELKELEGMLESLEAEEAQGKTSSADHAELKAQIERLRELILDKEQHSHDLDGQVHVAVNEQDGEHDSHAEVEQKKAKLSYSVPDKHSDDDEATSVAETTSAGSQSGGIDVDTEMPYGELEPFGREDTAQELTESSVRESDQMVDQLERAEVAEEKRAVFRALTRLRGAAITSFDGVARSQTGNIDEYNKVHQWRKTHPLHHLADEESDISKWAFPDNAD